MAENEGWTEGFDADIDSVHLVKQGANGRRFLMMKAAAPAGLISPDTIRSLIAKSDATEEHNVTAITGAPSDVAKAMHAIHQAAQPKDALMPAVLKADDAALAAEAVEGDTEPLPDADEVAATATEAPGDPDDPAAPAWEAVDAARARQALQLTIALKRLVEVAAGRENQEVAATGDEDAAENVWTLSDVSCAIDAILAGLAPFAVTEQAEADQGAADAVTKSGRVLSSGNEAKIRGAVDALTQVLNTLPAPADDAAPVAKTEKETPVPATIEKAKGDPQVAVYDSTGKLVGTVDQADVNPITEVAPPEGTDTADGDGADAEDAADVAEDAAEAPAVPAAEPAPAAPAVAAPDEAVIPGTDTVAAPAPEPTDDDKVTKAGNTVALAEALTPDAKQASDNAALAALVKSLQERVEELAKMPDDRRSPRVNGSTGVAGILPRDGGAQDRDSLLKAVEEAPDPVTKRAASNALLFQDIKDRFKPRSV